MEAEGEKELALEANERCLTLDRQCGEAWALKARLLAEKQGHDRDALKAATHAVALDAGGVDAVFLKAELLELEGSLVAAEETLLKALDAQPYNGELRARMASRCLIQHRVDDASALFSSTPDGIDHALLHTVEGRLHLAHADRLRDGTGVWIERFWRRHLRRSTAPWRLTGNSTSRGWDWLEPSACWASSKRPVNR